MCYICPGSPLDATAIIAGIAAVGALHRLAHGGLLRKWQAHMVAFALSGIIIALGHATWPSVIVAGAAWIQWVWPGRDFASTRSLLLGHLPWGVLASAVSLSPMPAIAALAVAGGYYGFQRWWHADSDEWLQPTVVAEAWSGWWVWGCAALAVV